MFVRGGITACSSSNNMGDNLPWTATQRNLTPVESNTNDVSLELSDILAAGAVCHLSNHASSDISFGDEFLIEILFNNKCFSIDEDGHLALSLTTLKSQDEIDLNIDWACIYGHLPSGNYRFLKKLLLLQKKYIILMNLKLIKSLC